MSARERVVLLCIFISILLHGIACLLLAFGVDKLELNVISRPHHDFVELRESSDRSRQQSPPIASKVSHSPLKRTARRRGGKPPISLSAITHRVWWRNHDSKSVVTKGESSADNPTTAWGSGGNQFERTRDYLLMKRVEEKLRGLVSYPVALAYREIGGVINVRLFVDRAGACDWERFSISGARPELRVYVLVLLKKFCASNFWHGFHVERPSSNVDLSFNFNTFKSEEEEPKILGNVILFEIPGKQHRATWKVGPIQGSFFAPNSILLNPTWIVENWNRLVLSKDPLEEFREN